MRRDVYNALLQERRDAYRLRGVSITAKMQYAELTELRAEDWRVAAVYRECEDAVLHRLDLAMAAFFRRCKRGETPGYPRFKGRSTLAAAGVLAREPRTAAGYRADSSPDPRRGCGEAPQGAKGAGFRASVASATDQSLVCVFRMRAGSSAYLLDAQTQRRSAI